MVDLRAIASSPELIGWTSLSVNLKSFQGTIVLSPKLILQKSAASLLVILKVSPPNRPAGKIALSSLNM